MIPCDLLWYQDESYAQVMSRAVKLAREYDQVVTIVDLVSGKRIKTVTPGTSIFEKKSWK